MQIASDSLSTFLSSSLNVELVYIILTSITAFSDKDECQSMQSTANIVMGPSAPAHPIKLNQPTESFLQEVTEACKVSRPHILKEIEIRNVAKWDSAKAKDFISNKYGAANNEKSLVED